MKKALKNSVLYEDLWEVVHELFKERKIQACMLRMISPTAASRAKFCTVFHSFCHILKSLLSALSVGSCQNMGLSLTLRFQGIVGPRLHLYEPCGRLRKFQAQRFGGHF